MATHPPMITNEVEFLPSASIMLSAVLDFAGGVLALLAPGYVAGWMGYDGVDFSIQSASVRIMGECARKFKIGSLCLTFLLLLPSSAFALANRLETNRLETLRNWWEGKEHGIWVKK